MQNKTETPKTKTGQTPVATSVWSMPNVSNMPWLTMPLEIVKQRIQTPKPGQKPVASPIWAMPDLSKMPWLTTPLDVIKQRMQMTKAGQKPVASPVWTFPDLVKAPWFPDFTKALWLATPMDVVKQKLTQAPKTGQTPVVPVTTPVHSTPVTSVPAKKTSVAPKWMPPMDQIYQKFWYGTNFSLVAMVTSLAIVSIQSPTKTILLTLTKDGTMVPTYSGGIMGFFRAMYAGTSASISGSVIRTGYVTGAKGGSKPIEEGVLRDEAGKEEAKKYSVNYSYVMAMAFGDILVTQIPESLSTLKKVPGLLPVDFTWKTPRNAWSLMMGGFAPRYASGMVNFGALCLLEERIAKGLPFDKNMAHFTAGMFSGMTAALFSYPFTVYKDYVLVQSKVVEGHLQNASTLKLSQELFYRFIKDPKVAMKSFGEMAIKQVPLRMGLTGVIFALVAGVGETMGTEPLKKVVPEKYHPSSPGKSKHSMFASKDTTPRIEEIEEPTNTKEQDKGSKLN